VNDTSTLVVRTEKSFLLKMEYRLVISVIALYYSGTSGVKYHRELNYK